MVRPDQDGIGGEWPVELDETWVGGATQGEGRGRHHKTLVAGAVEVRPRAKAPGPDPNMTTGQANTKHSGGHGRGFIAGRLRLQVLPGRSREELEPFVLKAVIPGSSVRTDGWTGYDNLTKLGYCHDPLVINGDQAKTEAHLPMIHIVFGNLDTWLLGSHHGVSPKHLQAYLNEFVFRFNRRFWPMVAFDSAENRSTCRGFNLPGFIRWSSHIPETRESRSTCDNRIGIVLSCITGPKSLLPIVDLIADVQC